MPKFKPGQCGNPHGRPKDPIKQQFLTALSIVEKKQRKSFLQHLCEIAYKDNNVAIALAKKLVPDKIEDVSELKERLVLIRPANSKDVPGLTD